MFLRKKIEKNYFKIFKIFFILERRGCQGMNGSLGFLQSLKLIIEKYKQTNLFVGGSYLFFKEYLLNCIYLNCIIDLEKQ